MAKLKDILDKYFEDVKFDRDLQRKISAYLVGYISTDREHMEFFGSNLLGVHRLRFNYRHVDEFTLGLMDLDMDNLNKELDGCPTVVRINKASGDTLNIILMYMIYRFNTSKLGAGDIQKATTDLAKIFIIRSFASYITQWFQFPADPKVVKVAYSNLNQNSLIRRYGTWTGVIEYRANALVEKSSPHYRTLTKWDDEKYAYAIVDTKDRVKDLILRYYSNIVKVRDEGGGIHTLNDLVESMEGEMEMAEKSNQIDIAINNMKSMMVDENKLISSDYIRVVHSVNKNTTEKHIRNVLEWMNHAYSDKVVMEKIDKFIEIHARYTSWLINNRYRGNKRDLSKLLMELRNLYLSTRSTDPELLEIRELVQGFVKAANPKALNKTLFNATSNSIILYFVIIRIFQG